MKVEYKRDLNHNYVIIQQKEEVDITSYRIRMILSNVIEGLLPCKVHTIDNQILFYYDITSLQTVASYYESRQFKEEDIHALISGIVRGLEKVEEYLLNPGDLVLSPEYIYMDIETKEIFCCYLPGNNNKIQEMLCTLTEYMLPLIDHKDSQAVTLGYEVYRKSMETDFQMHQIKEILFKSTKQHEQEHIDNRTVRYEELNERTKDEACIKEHRAALDAFFEEDEEEKGRWKEKFTEFIKNIHIPKRKQKNSSVKELEVPAAREYATLAGDGYKASEIVQYTCILSEETCNKQSVYLKSTDENKLPNIYLDKKTIFIGKLDTLVDYAIPVSTISRIHAKIRYTDGAYMIQDMNSKNGTYVNRKELVGNQESILNNGDEVVFANIRYVFFQ